MFVCWTYFHSPKYGHRKVEEGKREEQNRVALDSLVPLTCLFILLTTRKNVSSYSRNPYAIFMETKVK